MASEKPSAEETPQEEPQTSETAPSETGAEEKPAAAPVDETMPETEEMPKPPAEPVAAVVAAHVEESEGPAPRGAMAFVLILITGYIIYFALTWFEVFVLRGA